MRDTRERHPEYLTAPDSDYGPNLSSLEMYALEQEPVPLIEWVPMPTLERNHERRKSYRDLIIVDEEFR